MSDANKCDVCEVLFIPKSGDITLDVHIKNDRQDTHDSFEGIDLCSDCSAPVMLILGKALA